MDVSSSTQQTPASPQVEALKQATDVQERQILKVLESVNEESQKVATQKTGLGNNLNISA
ncbi:MAG: hypothetical protein L3J10_02955 [Sulfurimonas sp.]|nr:hypothetical protein [Sulfurimonas sp.]